MENLFITCYLKAAALLLNYLVLDRQKSQHLAITSLLLYIIVFILHWNIPESVINNLFLYFCGCFIPAFCSRFPIVWYICDIRLFFLYFFFLVFGIGQLVDLFFLRQVQTLFVSGLFKMTCIFACFLFCIFLDTFVFAGSFFVKCCQIGLLFSCATSCTRFML